MAKLTPKQRDLEKDTPIPQCAAPQNRHIGEMREHFIRSGRRSWALWRWVF
jgi:hypothetical protein